MLYLVTAILIWLFFFLTVLLHELGHAAGFRIGGGKGGWRVTVGSGAGILNTARITICLFPIGGSFIPTKEDEPQTKSGKLLMLAGGPAASLLLAVVFFVPSVFLRRTENVDPGTAQAVSSALAFLFYANLFQFFFTVIPIRYRLVCRGLPSDGLQLLRMLKHTGKTDR